LSVQPRRQHGNDDATYPPIPHTALSLPYTQALEKLSHEHPAACLRAGGLLAVLSYLDFFATGVQRVAVATASNMYAA
jgi:hypothetical protein